MRTSLVAASLSFAVVCTLSFVPRAEACGGFFCSQSGPVFQTAERILFAQPDAETVEAHVQILYSGPSEAFSWVVPTPSEPEIELGSDWMFQQLEQLTQRRVQYTYETEGDCRPEPPVDEDSWGGVDAGSVSDASDPSPPGLEVVAIEQIGAFDVATLRADAIEPMLEWLDANGYDIPEETGALLDLYIGGDTHFVAFKLTKNADAGDLQPVVLRYSAAAPMIPIQLTAVAAQPDMPVYTWIVSEQPAVPNNYAQAEVNDWRRIRSSGGLALYTEALNSTDAHAFVTDYRGDTSIVGDAIFAEWMFPEETLRGATDPMVYYWTLRDVAGAYSSDPAFLGVLSSEQCIPFPDELTELGVQPRDFYNCPDCYPEYLPETIDGEACTDLLAERIIEPRQRAQALFDTLPALSFMTTVLDPEEMTLDPSFCYQPDAEPVDVGIPVTDTTLCDPRLYTWEAPHRFTLDGESIFLDSRSSSESPLASMPALRSLSTGGCGEVEVVVDNSETIEAILAESLEDAERFWESVPELPDEPDATADTDPGAETPSDAGSTDGTSGTPWTPSDTGTSGADSASSERQPRDEKGCRAAPLQRVPVAWLLAGLAIAFVRRRR